MRKIFTIGETVYDIVFRDTKPVTAIPGGAMLNSSVSLGRLNLPVTYITEVGKDEIGDIIFEFLKTNNVETDFVNRFEDGKTALSLAFLDESDNASYSFYKEYPGKRLSAGVPMTAKDDIVLFGSFFALAKEVRNPLMSFIREASRNNSILIYDPNYRKPHGNEFPGLNEYIGENISFANIVRGSDEDFRFICGVQNADEAFDFVKQNGCSFLIYTVGSDNVEFRSKKYSFSVPVPKVKVVSTIGAGDNFNAGLIYSLYKENIGIEDLDVIDAEMWKSIVRIGIAFGSNVCGSYKNYISIEFGEGILSNFKSTSK